MDPLKTEALSLSPLAIHWLHSPPFFGPAQSSVVDNSTPPQNI